MLFMVDEAAQVFSHWLPPVATQVWARVRSCGIYSERSGAGAGFLQVLWSPLPHIPPSAPHSSSIITRGWCARPNAGGHTKWAQFHLPQEIKKKEKMVKRVQLVFLRASTFAVVIFILLLLSTYLLPAPEMCHRPDQAAHYYIWVASWLVIDQNHSLFSWLIIGQEYRTSISTPRYTFTTRRLIN
jgi:hypothetical protein